MSEFTTPDGHCLRIGETRWFTMNDDGSLTETGPPPPPDPDAPRLVVTAIDEVNKTVTFDWEAK